MILIGVEMDMRSGWAYKFADYPQQKFYLYICTCISLKFSDQKRLLSTDKK